MTDVSGTDSQWRGDWLNRLVARPGFQSWASRFPLTRGRARRDGEALFDLVQGFVTSQALMALAELDILPRLRSGPQSAQTLAAGTDIAPDRLEILLQAGAAMGLLRRKSGERFGLSRQGAAYLGVPGLDAMIRHHKAFYADLADPVALLRGPDRTALSEFWPYVFGAKGSIDPEVADTYSNLMAQSQTLVAADTLHAVRFSGISRLLDVGGGSGAFLAAVGHAYPGVALDLFDLPAIASQAEARFAREGLAGRATIHSGTFRDDPLPKGADAISLIRVLYDHVDDTVAALLAKVHDTLPIGGRLIISEPMSGGTRPDRAGDIYFAFYTLAMQTGRARSAETIATLCKAAGFVDIDAPNPIRPFVTSCVTARKED
ncbi:MAG: methyltransferase domain-containing protein [Rhodobacteraceae bacterium]|nr:methyltransferase domain-containing protein [Paracoccaceae bacterium]